CSKGIAYTLMRSIEPRYDLAHICSAEFAPRIEVEIEKNHRLGRRILSSSGRARANLVGKNTALLLMDDLVALVKAEQRAREWPDEMRMHCQHVADLYPRALRGRRQGVDVP